MALGDLTDGRCVGHDRLLVVPSEPQCDESTIGAEGFSRMPPQMPSCFIRGTEVPSFGVDVGAPLRHLLACSRAHDAPGLMPARWGLMTNWTLRDLEYWDDRIREQEDRLRKRVDEIMKSVGKKRLQEIVKYAAMNIVEEAMRKGFGCKV